MMKKIIIISMTCNRSDYCIEESVIRGTWGKDVGDNVKFYMYKSRKNKETCAKDGAIYTNANDDWKGTSTKTLEALRYLLLNDDFDYVVKTNTSSYINIELLKKFIETLPDDDDNVYGTRIIHNRQRRLFYLGGNFMIIPQKIVKVICRETKAPQIVDDIWLGDVIKKHFEKENVVFYEKLKRIPTVETFEKFKNYNFEQFKNIIAFRLKTNRKRISKNIIDNLKFLEENTNKHFGKFEVPEILEWAQVTMDGLRETKFEDALKLYSTNPASSSSMPLRGMMTSSAVRRAILRRPLERGLTSARKRIQFRGLK